MKIGEALRKERLAQGKTQARWVRDVDISVSYYSEIESGYTRNGKRSDIGSEVLLKLLKANNIDVVTFFESVIDSYNVNEKTEKIEKYRQELSIAFNEGNLGKIKVLKENLASIPSIPKNIYYQAVLFEADLKDHMTSLSDELKQKIDRYIYQSPDWITDTSALIIFGDSMPILSKQVLSTRMGQILRKYKDINSFPVNVKSRISTICINYLYNAIFIRKNSKYVNEVFRLIQQLPANETFGLKKVIARGFKDVLDGNQNNIKELKNVLNRSGLHIIAAKIS